MPIVASVMKIGDYPLQEKSDYCENVVVTAISYSKKEKYTINYLFSKQMKKTILFAIAIMLSFTASKAQDKAGDIKRLMTAMQMEKMVDNTMQAIRNAMKQQAAMQMQGEQSEQVKEAMESLMDFVSTETSAITKKMFEEDLPAVYEKYFTEEEVNDLILFYESTTGKKLLEKTPEMTGEIMSIMSTKYMPILSGKMKEKMKELSPETKQ